MSVEEYIAYHVTELCEKHHISKYRLSQATGITQTALKNIMTRKCVPEIGTISKICDAFGITMSQFFAGNGERLDLTELQKELLEIWDMLDAKEKDIVMTFVRGLKK